MYTPLQLAAILRDTLANVELGAGVSPNDPALLELKRIIQLKIAALESEHAEKASRAVLD